MKTSAADLAWLKQLKTAKPKTKEDALKLFFAPAPQPYLPAKWQRWEGLVVSIVNKYALPSCNRQDLIQAGWQGVGEAFKIWKPNRGSQLSTWMYIKIRKAVTTARSKEMTLSGIGPVAWRKHGANLYTTQMPPDDTLHHPCQTPYEEACSNEQTLLLLDALRLLNRKYKQSDINVLVDYLLGKPWSQIKKDHHGKDMRPIYRRIAQDARNIIQHRAHGELTR